MEGVPSFNIEGISNQKSSSGQGKPLDPLDAHALSVIEKNHPFRRLDATNHNGLRQYLRDEEPYLQKYPRADVTGRERLQVEYYLLQKNIGTSCHANRFFPVINASQQHLQTGNRNPAIAQPHKHGVQQGLRLPNQIHPESFNGGHPRPFTFTSPPAYSTPYQAPMYHMALPSYGHRTRLPCDSPERIQSPSGLGERQMALQTPSNRMKLSSNPMSEQSNNTHYSHISKATLASPVSSSHSPAASGSRRPSLELKQSQCTVPRQSVNCDKSLSSIETACAQKQDQATGNSVDIGPITPVLPSATNSSATNACPALSASIPAEDLPPKIFDIRPVEKERERREVNIKMADLELESTKDQHKRAERRTEDSIVAFADESPDKRRREAIDNNVELKPNKNLSRLNKKHEEARLRTPEGQQPCLKGTCDGISKHPNRYRPNAEFEWYLSKKGGDKVGVWKYKTSCRFCCGRQPANPMAPEPTQDRHKRIGQATEAAIVAFADEIEAPPKKRRRKCLVNSPLKTKTKIKAKAAKSDFTNPVVGLVQRAGNPFGGDDLTTLAPPGRQALKQWNPVLSPDSDKAAYISVSHRGKSPDPDIQDYLIEVGDDEYEFNEFLEQLQNPGFALLDTVFEPLLLN